MHQRTKRSAAQGAKGSNVHFLKLERLTAARELGPVSPCLRGAGGSSSEKVTRRAMMRRSNENRGIDEEVHTQARACSLASMSRKRVSDRVTRYALAADCTARRLVGGPVKKI